MKNKVLILVIILGFFSCKKEDDIPTVNDKYTIELDHDNVIYKVTYTKADNLEYVLEFNYTDEYVRAVKHNTTNSLVNIKQYYLINGLCDSLVDSAFANDQFKSARIHLYEYKYGYKFKEESFTANSQGVLDFDHKIDYIYSINGNLTQFVVMDQCTGNYSYNNLPNKIDLAKFEGDFMGKLNSNLCSDYSPGGCPSGPSTVSSNDSYTYTLDSEEYVIERVHIHTSGHHSSDDNPSRERTVTQFEYVFR